ncbi:MAG: hypothetical protein PHP44_11830, partial [Kiritimatiellae bacterium]|nr:hypothetical protein [Kiritimatiellia bacterium]
GRWLARDRRSSERPQSPCSVPSVLSVVNSPSKAQPESPPKKVNYFIERVKRTGRSISADQTIGAPRKALFSAVLRVLTDFSAFFSIFGRFLPFLARFLAFPALFMPFFVQNPSSFRRRVLAIHSLGKGWAPAP